MLGAILAGTLLLTAAQSACAQSLGARAAGSRPAGPLRWSKNFTRVTWTQYATTGAMAGLLFFGRDLYEGPKTSQWRRPILLDREARVWLAAGSIDGRQTANDISDYLMYGLMAYPFLDAALAAGVAHQSYDVAFQMTMISLHASLLQKLLSGLTKNLVRRQRPDEQRCSRGEPLSCGAHARSFFSGHTGSAFTGAALVCAHHENLPLYGGEGMDRAACGIALTAAATVGGLRVVADRHHLSDVVVGAAVGILAGYLVPNLINYDFGASSDRGSADGTQGTVAPMASQNLIGMQYLGMF